MAKGTTTNPNTSSRGENMRNYMPPMSKNAQVMSANLGGLFLSGSIVSGKKTMLITHNAGVKPKMIVVCPLATLAQASGSQNVNISVAAASAATITGFYVIGSQTQNTALKYAAFLMF